MPFEHVSMKVSNCGK